VRCPKNLRHVLCKDADSVGNEVGRDGKRRLHFDYGRRGLEVCLPEPTFAVGVRPGDRTVAGSRYARACHPPPLEDPVRALMEGCREPIDSPPLSQCAHGHRRALITVSDRTRPVPNHLLLRVLLDELQVGGIPPERVTVLVATGLHGLPGDDELLEVVGEEALSRCRVLWHNARDDSAQVAVGPLRGRAVWMDRAYVEAELRIVTGLIEPHFMAGYSGGRKGVCPGVLAARSILDWHRPAPLAHPRARAGVLVGNPVHREAREIAGLAPPHFLLNVTVDRERRLTGVFAGDWQAAWRAGVCRAERAMVVPLEEPADVVVTSAGGYPLDTTFYQAVKGVVTAAAAVVRPGGVVIMAASLADGVGSAEFQALFDRFPEPETFLEWAMQTDEGCIDQWQVQMLAQASRRAEVWVFSDGLSDAALRRLYVEPLGSVAEGIERARARLGGDCSILYLPEGPYIAPLLREENPRESPAAP